MPKSSLIRNGDGALDLSRIRVLLVDDNAFILTLVTRLLRTFGVASIAECSESATAFKLLKTRTFDLVICDYLMEPLDGIEFVRHIRTDGDSPCPEVPIIMLTGHTEYENVIQARNAGVTELLAKPISARSLLRRVIYVFDHPRAFIRSEKYVGPDRRRQYIEFEGEERRGGARSPQPATVTAEGAENDPRWGLSTEQVSRLVPPEADETGPGKAA